MALGKAREGVREVGVHAGGRDLGCQDDEGGVAHGLFDGGGSLGPVGDVQARGNVREGAGEVFDHRGAAHAGHAGAHARIDGDDVDLVACAIGQRGQQQSRFDGGIQAGRAPQGDGVDLRVRGGS